jgi:asparagine synthase (glutamine-hydrolysing)
MTDNRPSGLAPRVGLPKAVCALTFHPGVAFERRKAIVGRASHAVAGVAPGQEVVQIGSDGEVLLVAGCDCDDLDDPETGRLAILLTRYPYTADGRAATAGSILGGVEARGCGYLAGLMPPFGACLRSQDGPTIVTTDIRRMRPMYWCQQDGWAAAASSSLVLARVACSGLDLEAIGGYALTGFYIADSSPHPGVRALDAGCLCRLSRGRVDVAPYWVQQQPEGQVGWEEGVQLGIRSMQASVGACLAAYPSASIELSGGTDSRGILAAVPAEARRGMLAVTLGSTVSRDLHVARRITERWSMTHQVVDIDALARLRPTDAHELVWQSSRRRDFCSNPLAAGMSDWAEAQLDQGPRFNGTGGESARGRYMGLRQHFGPNDQLVDAYVRWRVIANDLVDPALFAPDFIGQVRISQTRLIQDLFSSFAVDWLTATDYFHIHVQLPRAQGLILSASSLDRGILNPYASPTYVEEWSWRTSPSDRRGSHLFCEVMRRLDPGLAQLKFATGMRPDVLASGGLRSRAATARRVPSRAVRKGVQHLRHKAKGPVGTSALASLVLEHWSQLDEPLHRLASVEVLDYQVVRDIARGRRRADAVTVGFLVGLDGMLESLAA